MQKSSPCGVGDRVYARVLCMYVNSVPACVAVKVHSYSHRCEANPSDLDSRLWEPVACGAKDGAPPRALRPAALLPLAADNGDERSSPGLRLSRSGAGPDKTWVRAIQIKTVIKIAKRHTIASIGRQVWVSNFRPKRRRRITLLRVR